MNIRQATSEYEAWLAGQTPEPLVQADLAFKHAEMGRADPFPFFRATYYRWAGHWTTAAGELADAPRVLAVGDCHLENFGTWRDADGRLCWGVNDFDEVDDLPWPHDLVRLAASVRVAKRGRAFRVKLGEACEAILAGYRRCLVTAGRPFVLEERHARLRRIAMTADREPKSFWGELLGRLGPATTDLPADAKAALDAVLPTGLRELEYRPRPKAGRGSLGRPRYVAVAKWHGAWVCREVKATAPPATTWACKTGSGCRAAEVVERAKRSPDPTFVVGERWVVRRLAPRSSRIDLDHMEWENLGRVLHAMGAEVANVHLGTPNAADAILSDLDRRTAGWLADTSRALVDLLEADRQEWRSGGG